MVSSPGPMGPAPEEEEYDRLPYVLPPGPYMPQKPDASYAALIGQAILSSPEHRLTLQEIYDWITIVYPYFKRGETTWMNSIRHVLSTTVCFRKVVRERSVGRSLWAIWDEDLECFKGGGFRKQLCKDVINTTGGKAGYSRFKQTRKRDEVDDPSSDARTVKKARPNVPHPTEILVPSAMHSYIIPAPLGSHLLFPTTRPTPQHQPYYESCFQQPQLAAEVIFPPLPPTAAYNRILAALPTATPVLEETPQTKDPGGSTTVSHSTPNNLLIHLLPHLSLGFRLTEVHQAPLPQPRQRQVSWRSTCWDEQRIIWRRTWSSPWRLLTGIRKPAPMTF
ncbi:hypothetical protein BD779DRAFT_88142 [Infundibulicybe gibba]|nr:hypothetical protein BD779DRAFT_88142 [Infundibulicybe gibba]